MASHFHYTTSPSSVIRADFSQGSNRYSDSSRGKQCVTNCLMFHIYCKLYQVKAFDKFHLHAILDTGDLLYKKITKTHDLLLISDLPSYICMNQSKYFSLKLQHTFPGCMVPGFKSDVGLSLEIALNVAFSQTAQPKAFLIFHASAVAILRENSVYYVFDSHSRGSNAFSHADGTCVLSILPSFATLVGFLRDLCRSLSSIPLEQVQFELHSIRITEVYKNLSNKTIQYITYQPSFSVPSVPSVVATTCQLIDFDPCTTVSKRPVSDTNQGFQSFKYQKISARSKRAVPQFTVSSSPQSSKPVAKRRNKQNSHVSCSQSVTEHCKMHRSASIVGPSTSSHKKHAVEETSFSSPTLSSTYIAEQHDMHTLDTLVSASTSSLKKRNLEQTSSTSAYWSSKPVTDQCDMHRPDTSVGTSTKECNLMLRNGLIADFINAVSTGPTYVCSCCTQTWFKNSISCSFGSATHEHGNVDFIKTCLTGFKSEDGKEWICRTCYSSLKVNKIPECAIRNGMGFPEKPPELNITEMEERLISPRIPFMQLCEKPRGGQRSLRGNVVNVPTDVQNTVKCLPRTLSNTETIQVKLKRRLSNKHSVMYESIRPNSCIKALEWLLNNSAVFQNEGIVMNEHWNVNDQDAWYNRSEESEVNLDIEDDSCDMPTATVNTSPDIQESEVNTDIHVSNDESCHANNDNNSTKIASHVDESNPIAKELTDVGPSYDTDDSDCWNEVKFADRVTGNTDTLLHPMDVSNLAKSFAFAPGEGQTPLGLYQDTNAEYLAFPTIYCGKKRPDNKDRQRAVHYSTICKWELRCFDRRAACSIPNLFFKLKKLQIKQIQDKVHLAMRKCKDAGKKCTAADVLNPTSFDSLVRLNEGYRVLRTLRGSPAYWEHAKKDVFAMIRQLGIPTWFLSLSAAETKWLPLLRVLGKLVRNEDYTDNDLSSLSWQDKSELIKSDPVSCARYFHHRVQTFISMILKGKLAPLGKLKDFFYRVEFQQRGSPHIHMLAWVENAPLYGQASNSVVQQFIDQHITCSKESSKLHLINYQTHRHARTCRKKGKAICRFGFPIPPMSSTLILEPLSDKEHDQNETAAADYVKICDQLNIMTMSADISFTDFLEILEMSHERYLAALRSSLTAPKIFLQRLPSEVRINMYNKDILDSWEANIDVQFVLDAYSCAAYIVSYISKGQKGMSNLLYQAVKDARKGDYGLKQQVRHIGNKFLTHVEISAQEAAFLVLQMPMRMASRTITFINTSESSTRTYLLKPLPMLEELPKNSTNISADNVLKRYERRPKTMNAYCLADFVANFDTIFPAKSKKSKKKAHMDLSNELPENLPDNDEEVLEEEMEEPDSFETTEQAENNSDTEFFFKDGTIMKRRKTPKVLRYVRFNRTLDPENFYREQLMLFLPWRDESRDLLCSFATFEESYLSQEVNIQANKCKYESQGAHVIEMVEESMDILVNNTTVAPETQHNDEVDASQETVLSSQHGCFDPGQITKTYDLALDIGIVRKQLDSEEILVNDMSNEAYTDLAKMLNQKQEIFFYHVLHWLKTNNTPIHCFLTGGAGVGKSIVTTALYQAVTRFYRKQHGNNPDNIKAVLCAPTGKAAYNIGGNTIHSLFCIPANQGFKYKPLDSQQLDTLRVKFSNLKVVFIDEISMVGNKLFNYINLRLQDIFTNQIPFGGVSIVAIGDLFQLKPVMDGWIFKDLNSDYGPIAMNLWQDHFRIFELTEIMRQKNDQHFAALLNRLREGLQTPDDIGKLEKRVLKATQNSVVDIPHLFTTNVEVNKRNVVAFNNAPGNQKCSIPAIDSVSGDHPENIKTTILGKVSDNPTHTMGLFQTLNLAVDLPVEVCVNIDVEDGLTNGTPGIVKKLDFRVEGSKRCSIVWVLFPEQPIGSKARTTYAHLYTNDIDTTLTPIMEITRTFTVGRSHSCPVTRRQFPLRLAAAKTIHKAQGSTMTAAVLHFGSRKQEHMHYVGLSRVRELQNVHILELNTQKICVSGEVLQEMLRMRSLANLLPCFPVLSDITSDLKVVYHNTRSLHLHIDDLLADHNLQHADILAISESRLTSKDSNDRYQVPGFRIYRADQPSLRLERPYNGMVVYSKVNLQNVHSQILHGIDTVFASVLVHNTPVQLVFIYSSPRVSCISNLVSFLGSIDTMFESSVPIVIMGDANIDITNPPPSLSCFLLQHNMKQLVRSATTDYGSCIDHIYVRCNSSISYATLESYYSDHKPIVAYMPLQPLPNTTRTNLY